MLKYLAPFLIYVGALVAFFSTGWVVFIPLIYAWVVIPLLELLIKPDPSNMDQSQEELARKNRIYDFFLYLVVPLQYTALACFLYSVSSHQQGWVDMLGKTMVMGLLCGTFGINVGHELGHRKNAGERILARLLLMSSLYMHFYIEHNKGHHKRVATPEDPSSARFGEPVYAFYFRSIVYSYLDAWQISIRDQLKKGRPAISLSNEMVIYHLVQLAFVAVIFFVAGITGGLLFIAAAMQGILLLETVNYIEHYGLSRRAVADAGYERTKPEHSWNSDHIVGRLMLFELSRHSDHHFSASRKYQLLRHHDHSPQMPTGYPGMMLLSLVPPLWFRIMNRRINTLTGRKS